MSQPREHEVPCGGCSRMTPSVTRYCDRCSSHPGECEKCGEYVERRYRVLVPLDDLNSDEQRHCKACLEGAEETVAVERGASDRVMYARLQRETWGMVS